MSYPIAYQLYSSRLFLPLEAQFPELKAMGYDAIEPWLPAYEADARGFRRTLDANGLKCFGFHMPLAGLVKEPNRFIDIALMISNHQNYASFPDATVAFFGEHWFIRLIQFFLLGVGFVWVSVDMARIVAGRFKDAQGRLLLTSGDTDTK